MKAVHGGLRDPASSASPALSELARSLAGVKPFPPIVLTIRQAVADPRNGVAEIGRLVEKDVGISATLLRLANAPASGLVQRCNSVRHAVSLLGMRRVSEAVTSAAALALLETAQHNAPGAADHAIAVAGVARLLAPITGASPDAAFTAGLLHDVGALLLLQSEDDFYEGLVEQYGEDEEPSPADERALLGFDHAALGAEVLRQWNLPEPLPQIVALHHEWERAVEVGGSLCVMVALIRVADLLVRELPRTAEPNLDQLQRVVVDPAFAYIGLNAEELFKLWGGLRRACEKAEGVEQAAAPDEVYLDVGHLPPPSVREAAPASVRTPHELASAANPQASGGGVAVGWWIGAAVVVVASAGVFLLVLQ